MDTQKVAAGGKTTCLRTSENSGDGLPQRMGVWLVLIVYVDDLTLSGPVELHAPFWHSVRLEPEVFVQGGEEGCRVFA